MFRRHMKKSLGIVALTLACTTLVLVVLWRLLLFDYLEARYPAALYFAQIRAIDDQTSKPVDCKLAWDYEAITPFIKGSGPESISTAENKTVTVALVGLHLKGGLPIKIVAEGYSPGMTRIWSHQTGGSSHVEEVRLRRSNSAFRAKDQTR